MGMWVIFISLFSVKMKPNSVFFACGGASTEAPSTGGVGGEAGGRRGGGYSFVHLLLALVIRLSTTHPFRDGAPRGQGGAFLARFARLTIVGR